MLVLLKFLLKDIPLENYNYIAFEGNIAGETTLTKLQKI
jgi:hypothetical protein